MIQLHSSQFPLVMLHRASLEGSLQHAFLGSQL